MNQLDSRYPPQLSPQQEEYLITTIKRWALQHGLTVKPAPTTIEKEANLKKNIASNAPITLFPSLFPKTCYETAKTVQTVYNDLYAVIANDEAWLGKAMGELIDVDDFIGNLWKIHLDVKREGYVQDLSLGLFRSDYIVHCPLDSQQSSLKQVEFNTISSSFAGLSDIVADLHTSLLTSPASIYPSHPILQNAIPPRNGAVSVLADGLAAAHKAYGPSKSDTILPLCILFIVQDEERNIFDQLALSERLMEHYRIPVFRIATLEILEKTSVPSANPSRPLIYTHSQSPEILYEATTVYLRAFYGPSDFTGPDSWTARTQLERSAAIKCPSILSQLSGCKKIQQLLADPDGPPHLHNLFSHKASAESVDLIRSTFAPQYSLDETGQGRKLALDTARAETHVLKPQREGGGNNIYRSAIPSFLKALPEKDWKGYILMELIQPWERAENTILRSDGEVFQGKVTSELGIFGSILWRKNGEVLENKQGGWLLRTKGRESNEGGIAAGFSALDSILLV